MKMSSMLVEGQWFCTVASKKEVMGGFFPGGKSRNISGGHSGQEPFCKKRTYLFTQIKQLILMV